MKKLLCLILALMLVFSLAACGEASSDGGEEKETEPKKSWDVEDLVGTWRLEQDFPMEQFHTIPGAKGTLKLVVLLTFDEEGMVTYEMDKEGMMKQKDTLTGIVEEALYAAAAEEGLSKDEADEDIEEGLGMSVQEYAEAIAENLLESVTEGTEEPESVPYTVEDKTLSFNEITLKFYIQGNKLVLEEAIEGDTEDAEFPMTLKRVKD